MSHHPVSLERAYAACQQIARQHYENFPVASWLLPPGMRPHVAAVYAFARHADDLADEGDAPPDKRVARLDDWLSRLRRRLDTGRSSSRDGSSPEPPELVCQALAATIRRCELPVELFEDLLSAFRQDVTVSRYRSWADLLDYCRRSANPVGRLVLRIAGYEDAKLDAESDHVCSALQLTNFLQDFEVDWGRGRLYVPADIYEPLGATEAELDEPQLSVRWRQSIEEVAIRTRRAFARGRAVCDGVGGRLGVELRLTWLGGRRILDRLERSGYDPRATRPSLGLRDGPPLVWQAVTWRSRPTGSSGSARHETT